MNWENGREILMVVAGNVEVGEVKIPSFIRSQAESLEQLGQKVYLGIVDDRTSLEGIWRNIQKLRRLVEERNPLVIHAQYGSVTAAIGASIRGTRPLVISFCGDDLLGTPNPRLIWRFREKISRAIGLWAAKQANRVIVKSQNLFDALPHRLRDKTTILPNGVKLDEFPILKKETCRQQLGWNLHSKILLFNLGENDNQTVKNFPLAQQTLGLLQGKNKDVELKTLANVTRETVNIMLNAADCLLVTSFHEGSPNIIKEAMACNLPVVSVPCGDAVERLAFTIPGGVRPYEATLLAEEICTVLETPNRSNGRTQLILQGLSSHTVSEKLKNVYEEIQGTQSLTSMKTGNVICAE